MKEEKKALETKILETLNKIAPESTKKDVSKQIKKAAKAIATEIIECRKKEAKKKAAADKKLAKTAFKNAVLSYAKANAPAAAVAKEKK
jgi:hypothetical protein